MLSFEVIDQKGGDYVRSGGDCRLGDPVQTFDKRNWEGEGDGSGGFGGGHFLRLSEIVIMKQINGKIAVPITAIESASFISEPRRLTRLHHLPDTRQ